MNRRWVVWAIAAVAVVALLVAPWLLQDRPYIMHIAIVGFFYAILSSSWSLLAGQAGQFSFGHMAFMAIGAYATGVLSKFIRLTTEATRTCAELPLGKIWIVWVNSSGESCLDLGKVNMPVGTVIRRPPVVTTVIGGIILGGIFGLLVGLLVLRLRRTYLALFTIGFSEILRTAINAELDLTNGPNGLELAPLFPDGVRLLGQTFGPADRIPPYYVMVGLFLLSMALMYSLAGSRFGLFIRSIREDEEAASSLGVHIVRYKVLVFVITSMIAAAAGAVEAHYIGVITPNILLIMQMSLVIAMAVIGGLESLAGAAIGAIIIEFALELLRTSFTIGPIEVDMTTWRLVFFGLLLMLTLRFWNNGVFYPLIQRFTRAGLAAETVAKRQAALEEEA
jgi:branched-chain amino acid transport system permease protein